MDIRERLQEALESTDWLATHSEEDESLCRAALARIEHGQALKDALMKYLCTVSEAGRALSAAVDRADSAESRTRRSTRKRARLQ